MNLNVFIYSLLLLFAVVSCGKTGNNGGTALNEHTDKNNARNVRETEKIKERRIYYLDQTGSMEDNNNIWGDAKRSLCNSIMDLDSTTEIIVIPFTDSYHCLKPVTIGKDSVFCGSQRQNLCNEIWHLKTIKPIKTTKKNCVYALSPRLRGFLYESNRIGEKQSLNHHYRWRYNSTGGFDFLL